MASQPNHWVIDYETLINCTVLCATHYKTSETKVFVIHKLRNDIVGLIKFLNDCISQGSWHVTFNGLAFDHQITHRILEIQDGLVDGDPEFVANMIYTFAQSVIDLSNKKEFLPYSHKDFKIRCLDVFKLNHWDNPAKRSSLKWIQYNMDWENIQEMPIHHSTFIKTQEQVDEIVSYCINDIRSTKRIMEKSSKQINLRGELTKTYGIDLYNASEPKISKELFLHFLSKKLNTDKYTLKYSRTYRENITVKDIILPYIRFEKPEFNAVLNKFKELVIPVKGKLLNNDESTISQPLVFNGVTTHFGYGGLHGARKSGIYSENSEYIIITSDVVSFYPRLAIVNKWAPAHIPKEDFCEQYAWFFDERMKIPKKDPRNYVYKIVLNSTYGLSNDENSFLYDPEFTMRITINGQLSLSMLYEMLSIAIPGSLPLMQNTDGLEMMIPREYKDKYFETCKKWEEITGLQLEHGQYEKLFLADVNNYIALNTPVEIKAEEVEDKKKDSPYSIFFEKGGKHYMKSVKMKGRFDFVDLALHKNKSRLVIPKGVYYYLIHGIDPEVYVRQNKNIFDFCAGIRVKGDWELRLVSLSPDKTTGSTQQKVVRYIKNSQSTGAGLMKINTIDGRNILIDSLAPVTILNKLESTSTDDYDIDYPFYVKEIKKQIDTIVYKESPQLKLF